MPVLLLALLTLAACGAAVEPVRAPGPHVMRGYGKGFPWTGYQHPYVGSP